MDLEAFQLQGLPDKIEFNKINKGMIIHGWALQLLIIEHESVGELMTHFGWKLNFRRFACEFANDHLAYHILSNFIIKKICYRCAEYWHFSRK